MKSDRFSGRNAVLIIAGAIPVIWFAIVIAPFSDRGLAEMIKGLSTAMDSPFTFVWSSNSLKAIFICLAAYFLAVGVYLDTEKNYRHRQEHGSAKWGSPYMINRKYAGKDITGNKTLTQNVAIGFDTHKHRRNLNVLVCGGSGSGKTRFYAKPNIMNANTSFVILDPNGEPRIRIKVQ